jgi:ribonuclease HI
MKRLDAFPGFTVRKTREQSSFNPFYTELHDEPKRTEDVVDMIAKGNEKIRAKMENILDAEPSAQSAAQEEEGAPAQEIPILFPQVKAKEEPLEATEAIVPMDQPRDKDGKRLLYRHPNLPRVGIKGAYWLLVGSSDKSETAWLLQFDGAANPNPGPASAGAVLWSPKDLEGRRKPVFEMGKFLGKATNNIAEAQGILLGLKMAAMRGAREILIEGDSELIVFQHTRRYKVSDKNLKVWWSEAQAAMMDETCFDWIAIRQVRREFNERADSITKEVLGRKEGFSRNG